MFRGPYIYYSLKIYLLFKTKWKVKLSSIPLVHMVLTAEIKTPSSDLSSSDVTEKFLASNVFPNFIRILLLYFHLSSHKIIKFCYQTLAEKLHC
jgi:hypothetical protein